MSSYVQLSLKILEVLCAWHWLCVPLMCTTKIFIFYQAAFKGSLKKIQDRQTKALKICLKIHGNHDVHEFHVRSNLAMLEKRRESHGPILNFMYKRKDDSTYLDQRKLQTRAYKYSWKSWRTWISCKIKLGYVRKEKRITWAYIEFYV